MEHFLASSLLLNLTSDETFSCLEFAFELDVKWNIFLLRVCFWIWRQMRHSLASSLLLNLTSDGTFSCFEFAFELDVKWDIFLLRVCFWTWRQMEHSLVSSLLLNLTSDEISFCLDFACIAVHIRLTLSMKLSKANALRSRNIWYVLFEDSLLRFWIFTLNFLLKLETLLEVRSRDYWFLVLQTMLSIQLWTFQTWMQCLLMLQSQISQVFTYYRLQSHSLFAFTMSKWKSIEIYERLIAAMLATARSCKICEISQNFFVSKVT